MNWIKFSEQRPIHSADILVTDQLACTVAYYNKETDDLDFFENSSFWKKDEVTYWMPLPKMPFYGTN